jgi:hypothetical protein
MSLNAGASRERLWPFLLKAGALGVLFATIFPAFFYVGMGALSSLFDRFNYKAHPGLWDILKSTVLLCPITIVWYGPFGFVAGSIWAALANWRGYKIRSVKRVLASCCLYGLFASFIFPFYDAFAQFQPLHDIRYSLPQLPVVVFFCILSSLIGAFVFRKRFLPATVPAPQ